MGNIIYNILRMGHQIPTNIIIIIYCGEEWWILFHGFEIGGLFHLSRERGLSDQVTNHFLALSKPLSFWGELKDKCNIVVGSTEAWKWKPWKKWPAERWTVNYCGSPDQEKLANLLVKSDASWMPTQSCWLSKSAYNASRISWPCPSSWNSRFAGTS